MDYTTLLSDRLLSYTFNWLDLNTLVHASHVCRRWRRHARTHSSYWQRIELVDTNYYDDSKTRISAHKIARFCNQLAIGGRRPVSVSVDINYGCTDVEGDVFVHINTHMHRIASLTLHIPDITFVDEFSALCKPAPALQSLHIWLYHLDCDPSNGHEIPSNLFAGSAPSLLHVILQDIDIMPTQPAVPAFGAVQHAKYLAVDKDAEYPAPTLHNISALFPGCESLGWSISDFPVHDESPRESPTERQRISSKSRSPSHVFLNADTLDLASLGGFLLAGPSSLVLTAVDIEDACLRDLLSPRREQERGYLAIDRRGAEHTALTFFADSRAREVRIVLERQRQPLPVLKPYIYWERVFTLRVALTDACWKFLAELCDEKLHAVRSVFFTLRGKTPAISRLKAIARPLRCFALEHVYFASEGAQSKNLRQSWVQAFIATRLCPSDPVHIVFDSSVELEVDLPDAKGEADGWDRSAVSAVSRIHAL